MEPERHGAEHGQRAKAGGAPDDRVATLPGGRAAEIILCGVEIGWAIGLDRASSQGQASAMADCGRSRHALFR